MHRKGNGAEPPGKGSGTEPPRKEQPQKEQPGKRPPHQARPHADRARQFMPFAALKGYYDLVRQEERTPQPRHQLTEEEALELSVQIRRLQTGSIARVAYYDRDAYITIHGAVARIDETFRTLRIVTTDIPFDDILRIDEA